MPFLALDNLTKSFGSHLAVDRLTFAVEKGEFVSLLGPSGCGKTTTLQMIAGFVEPTSGAIRLAGRDLLAVKPAKRGLGIVFREKISPSRAGRMPPKLRSELPGLQDGASAISPFAIGPSLMLEPGIIPRA